MPKVDPRVAERRRAVARAAGRKRLRILLIAFAVFVALGGLVGLTLSPVLDVDRVEVRGSAHTSIAAVLKTTGLSTRGHAMITVDRFDLASKVERLPWVDTAEVTRRWPNTVRIQITERVPLGVVAVPGGVAILDKTGRVLATASAPPADTIAITTTKDKVPAPGRTVRSPLQSALTILTQLSTDLRAETQAIHRLNGDTPTYDLTLNGNITIRLGDAADMGEKLTAAESVLVAARASGTVIDVRVPRSPTVTHSVIPTTTVKS